MIGSDGFANVSLSDSSNLSMVVGKYVASTFHWSSHARGRRRFGAASHRETAERFAVRATSVSGWRKLQLQQGNVCPGPMGGDRNFHKKEAHADQIMIWLGVHGDGTFFELRNDLAAQRHRDQEVSIASLSCPALSIEKDYWVSSIRRVEVNV